MGPGDTPALTLFLAEDHVAVREVLVAYIKLQSSFRVVGEASDGLVVVENCRRLKPDVVLLDVELPGMNGISIARSLTTTTPETRILAFTAHIDVVTIRQLLEAGVRGIIEKTTSAENLMRAIETVGKGHAYFGEQVSRLLQQSMNQSSATAAADNLTSREREVLQLVAEGCSNKEVSSRLGISVKTAENHRHHLMQKLNTRNAADLTREAFRLGLIRNLKSSDPN